MDQGLGNEGMKERLSLSVGYNKSQQNKQFCKPSILQIVYFCINASPSIRKKGVKYEPVLMADPSYTLANPTRYKRKTNGQTKRKISLKYPPVKLIISRKNRMKINFLSVQQLNKQKKMKLLRLIQRPLRVPTIQAIRPISSILTPTHIRGCSCARCTPKANVTTISYPSAPQLPGQTRELSTLQSQSTSAGVENQKRGYKVRSSIKPFCEHCSVVKRKGVLYVICKKDPKHKQRQG